ncbi:hypothetical protein CC80DRAFT_13739 [Byssothecium circinans]|uniref:Uncharacterized protein n=1 Tax=Byssothecium circinans TaxID=147558 RepID=A0A6A5UJ66_9PLEO|nr:hypothetical protein CC80DRAFT_13739 [Byssothecium circinans]
MKLTRAVLLTVLFTIFVAVEVCAEMSGGLVTSPSVPGATLPPSCGGCFESDGGGYGCASSRTLCGRTRDRRSVDVAVGKVVPHEDAGYSMTIDPGPITATPLPIPAMVLSETRSMPSEYFFKPPRDEVVTRPVKISGKIVSAPGPCMPSWWHGDPALTFSLDTDGSTLSTFVIPPCSSSPASASSSAGSSESSSMSSSPSPSASTSTSANTGTGIGTSRSRSTSRITTTSEHATAPLPTNNLNENHDEGKKGPDAAKAPLGLQLALGIAVFLLVPAITVMLFCCHRNCWHRRPKTIKPSTPAVDERRGFLSCLTPPRPSKQKPAVSERPRPYTGEAAVPWEKHESATDTNAEKGNAGAQGKVARKGSNRLSRLLEPIDLVNETTYPRRSG